MTRLPAILAAAVLCAGVPTAHAASSTTSDPIATTVAAPSHATAAQLETARAQALAAYRQARDLARRLGRRSRPPRAIRRAESVERLRDLRAHWLRRSRLYAVMLNHALRERRATRAAMGQIGTRYTWGGASPRSGFDCSGLVMWAYGRVGVHLGHSTWSQMASGRPVRRAHLRRGDLVFEEGGGHVGIYLGRGVMLAATHTGGTVSRSPLSQWQVVAIRRVA